MSRPPLSPFNEETAILKVRAVEDAWNSQDPERVVRGYPPDNRWRNRIEFPHGRAEIQVFLTRKWERERDYRLVKELCAFAGDQIAVRFGYEFRDQTGLWFRAHGNENWQFDGHGLMARRLASISDPPITEADRLRRWPQGPRPADYPSLSALGL